MKRLDAAGKEVVYNARMSTSTQPGTNVPLPQTANGQNRPKRVLYPDSDGQPMAENTLQFQWIVTIKENLELLFADRADVFVAGDLLWYPVEGKPEIRQAPDALVVFGRPKGYRRSYMQWVEEGIPPQIVFEVLSPGNRAGELIREFRFYEQYGVEEYYIYDPDSGDLAGHRRENNRLEEIPKMNGWISPRLGCRFEIVDNELVLTAPDGRRFLTFGELGQQLKDAEKALKEKDQAMEKLREQLRALGVQPEV